jgi:glycosyltransferase involved in cell wall biosynthesis
MMPAYNAEKYIGEAIQSCIDQTYRKWELIIIDDCSTDKTYEVAKKYENDERIRIFQNTYNMGEGATRNTCIRYSNGSIIARLDADDTQEPMRLEKLVEALEYNDMVYSGGHKIYNDGSKQIINRCNATPEEYTDPTKSKHIINSSITTWKYVYENVGHFNKRMTVGTDADWAIRAFIKMSNILIYIFPCCYT